MTDKLKRGRCTPKYKRYHFDRLLYSPLPYGNMAKPNWCTKMRIFLDAYADMTTVNGRKSKVVRRVLTTAFRVTCVRPDKPHLRLSPDEQIAEFSEEERRRLRAAADRERTMYRRDHARSILQSVRTLITDLRQYCNNLLGRSE